MTDEPEDTAPLTEHQVRMANVDAALAPAVKAADNIGVISYHHMKQILACVRQAIAVAFDPPATAEDTGGERLDMLAVQRKEASGAAAPEPEITGHDANASPFAEEQAAEAAASDKAKLFA